MQNCAAMECALGFISCDAAAICYDRRHYHWQRYRPKLADPENVTDLKRMFPNVDTIGEFKGPHRLAPRPHVVTKSAPHLLVCDTSQGRYQTGAVQNGNDGCDHRGHWPNRLDVQSCLHRKTWRRSEDLRWLQGSEPFTQASCPQNTNAWGDNVHLVGATFFSKMYDKMGIGSSERMIRALSSWFSISYSVGIISYNCRLALLCPRVCFSKALIPSWSSAQDELVIQMMVLCMVSTMRRMTVTYWTWYVLRRKRA